MIIDRDPNVYDKNDYDVILRLSHREKGIVVPTAGLTDLDVWISDTEGGAMIHSSLKVRAVEIVEVPGDYEITILGLSINAQLFTNPPTYDKKDVFIVAQNVAKNVNTSERVKAFLIRRVS